MKYVRSGTPILFGRAEWQKHHTVSLMNYISFHKYKVLNKLNVVSV